MQIKFFKKEYNFKKKDFQFNPNFFWKLIVGIAVAIILLSFFFSYQLFLQVNQESVLSVTNDGGQVPLINKDRIDKVLNYFSVREQRSTEILNSPTPFVDPSL